jgi:hypothetical protein
MHDLKPAEEKEEEEAAAAGGGRGKGFVQMTCQP